MTKTLQITSKPLNLIEKTKKIKLFKQTPSKMAFSSNFDQLGSISKQNAC